MKESLGRVDLGKISKMADEIIKITDKNTKSNNNNNIINNMSNEGVIVSGKSKKIASKRFEFSYSEKINEAEFFEKVSERFPDSLIESHGVEGISKFTVSFPERKFITSTKRFGIGGREPVIRDLKHIDEVRDGFYRNNIAVSALMRFLKIPNKDDGIIISEEIQRRFEQTKIFQHSEYNLSCIFYEFITYFGNQIGWDNFFIYSTDTKMEEYSKFDIKTKNFRCDLIVFFNSSLFVFEFKYKFDRNINAGKKALMCIKKRSYSRRISAYLKKNYIELFKKIDDIYEVGIGYCVKNNKKRVDLAFKKNSNILDN